ncbi:TonB-dependent receptor [Aquirhabdus parva]|nr:TonB-dependent receptor [Aquirhabdus parva]
MKLNILAHSLRVIFTGGMTVGMGLMVNTAHADDKVERVEVTGSSIKGIAAQSASPITVIKTEALARAGITTASEALQTISANQTQFTASNNVGASKTSGPSADLRGLGANKTLVLLNGRRVANSAFDGTSVDLSIIPIAALDRIEVLRDGASAIYGTDAIGGVINFITKRSVTGLTVTAEGSTPTHSGGGQEGRFNITGGFGDLDKDGFNLFGVADYHSQQSLLAKDRSFTDQGGVRPDLGISSTSGNTFPANFYDPTADLSGNPYAATGCNPPNTFAKGAICRYNTQTQIGIVPKTYEFSFLGKGTLKLDDNNKLGFEYLHSESNIRTTVAQDLLAGGGSDYFVPNTSKYFPGNGITPAVAGLSGDPISVNYRGISTGPRINDTVSKQDRALFTVDGTVFDWDYKGGVSYTESNAADRLLAGYINNDAARIALENGTLNPFGAQAAADTGVPSSLTIEGPYEYARTKATSVDFTISRAIADLPAGPLGFALGTSYRHEEANYNVDYDISTIVNSTGTSDAKSAAGRRDVSAIFTEFQIPILPTLEAQLAVRYDKYSDVGGTTNPKIAFRWVPLKEILFRGSFSTGFRAPSLYELNDPNSKTFTANPYDDPVLCPGGNVAAGGVSARDCGQQFYKLQGGNKDLRPETSKSYTFGTVIEPVKDVTVSADYYNITIKNQISTLYEGDIFADPVKYASEFVRNADGSLDYISNTNLNLGGVKTSGVDLGLNWRIPTTDFGTFNLSLDGTYVNTYKYQSEQGGEWFQNAGVYANGQPYFRWRHTAGINWKLADWSALFQQSYESGYKDDNTAAIPGYDDHKVPSWTHYNLSGTYSGIKNLTLTAGVKNIFNTNPPATNTTANFQIGYDPRYTDPLGRVLFLRATYKFL